MEVAQVTLTLTPGLSCKHDTAFGVDDKSIPRVFEIPLELPGTPVDPNEALADELRGKTMRIPNMLDYMHGWPARELNQHYRVMQTLFDEALDR